MFSIFDCRTKARVSERVYATCEEASHDYHLNRGHTFVGAIPCKGRTLRQRAMELHVDEGWSMSEARILAQFTL